jgi:hypothetical protein
MTARYHQTHDRSQTPGGRDTPQPEAPDWQ